MGVFPIEGSNIPTQLWVATRYLESVSLLIAPLFLKRKLSLPYVLLCYSVVVAIVLYSIFSWHIFPDSFLEGTGLTRFKKVSELIISVVFCGAVFQLILKRQRFDAQVLRLLIASIMISVGSEIAFIFYVNVYGLSNFIGHILKIISFYLIYKAIINTGLIRPFDLLYRSLISVIRYIRDEYGSLSDSERLKFIKEIDLVSNRTVSLLDNLLDWAKCQTGDMMYRPEKYRLKDLLLEATVPLESYARTKHIELRVAGVNDLCIFGDRNMITTIIRNLLSNAIKFSNPNSNVSIEVSERNDQIELKIKDTGIGIKPKNIGKLFKIEEHFTRLGTEREKGTGLGLILCKNFITLHGGDIWLESEWQKGTTFHFTVPSA
jgi:signal transduction histidine kinase